MELISINKGLLNCRLNSSLFCGICLLFFRFLDCRNKTANEELRAAVPTTGSSDHMRAFHLLLVNDRVGLAK